MTGCVLCSTDSRPVDAHQGLLCDGCANRILTHLRHIEACYTALDATPVVAGSERGAPGFASAAPLRLDVVVHRDHRSKPGDDGRVAAFATLVSWAQLVALEHATPAPQDVTIAEECAFLRRNHAWIIEQPWVDNYAADLDDIRHQLRLLIGLAPPPPAGHCMVINCHGLVYPTDDASGVQCRACRRLYTGIDLARLRYSQEACP